MYVSLCGYNYEMEQFKLLSFQPMGALDLFITGCYRSTM